ncbi:M15 family metallopeptidase [Actinospica sp.]|uniref:M15 family metallopeptidase n=1 Tax=Actinospica sp. TaxID=1872142 RepID=UPI002C113C4A|nr:M15 family metallopeptidase [Actinospica sp.]HWG22529.1 M15 family metallopeptidase [Actinospica sp.]
MRGDIVLIADPRVARIPVVDNGEPLVDLAEAGFLIDIRQEDPLGAPRQFRAGAAERLAQAEKLLPAGLRLLVVEAYRPLELQRKYFDGYSEELAQLNPEYTPEQLRAAASRFVSPPELAPHTAGAAIDLTLCDDEGRELDMGTILDATPEQSDGKCYTAAAGLPPEAAANRAVLVEAMHSAGFVNYPTEWWHYSYGDRYWALMSQRTEAIYGPIEYRGPLDD